MARRLRGSKLSDTFAVGPKKHRCYWVVSELDGVLSRVDEPNLCLVLY